MFEKLRKYWLWQPFVFAIAVWVLGLAIATLWPLFPGNFDPSRLDGKGPYTEGAYVCRTFDRDYECAGQEFWVRAVTYSPVGIFIIAEEARRNPFQVLFFLIGAYVVLFLVWKNDKRWMWGAVPALIIVIALAMIMSRGAPQEIAAPIATTPQATTDSQPRVSSPHALADAMALVPEGVDVFLGSPIKGDWYWVASRTYLADDQNQFRYQYWAVNPLTKEVKEVQQRVTGIPSVQVAPEQFSINYGYLKVITDQGWEGFNESFIDVYSEEDGRRLATVGMGNSLPWIETEVVGGAKHEISIEPQDPCKGLTADKDVPVTGLRVDNVVIPFQKPHTIRCSYSEFAGAALMPEFSGLYYYYSGEVPRRHTVEFVLPWGKGVRVDMGERDPKKAVTISE